MMGIVLLSMVLSALQPNQVVKPDAEPDESLD